MKAKERLLRRRNRKGKWAGMVVRIRKSNRGVNIINVHHMQ
jgi:hypothetical protein